MTVQQIFESWLELAFRRRTTVSRVAVAVFGTVFVLTMLWPPLYQSSSKIMIQINRANLLVSPGLETGAANPANVIAAPVDEQDLNSEIELLTSRQLVEHALEGLTDSKHQSFMGRMVSMVKSVIDLPGSVYGVLHSSPEMTPRQQWASELAARLSSSVIKRSNVIEVDFRAHDPQWAETFLRRLLDQYMEFHARISQDPQTERFFQQQSEILQERLRRSEEKLKALELQTGITSLAEQKQALVTQLSSFEAEYRRNKALLAATQQQVVSLGVELGKSPEKSTRESKVVQNNALQQLKPQVMAMEAERAELLSRYTPTSARIREIDAKLDAARKILHRENQSEVQETNIGVNPIWEQLSGKLAEARVAVASIGSNQEALQQQIEEYREQLKALATDGIEVERLQRQVETDKEAYLSYTRKGEEARAAQALNQSKILNVTIVEAPTQPLHPVSPRLEVNLAAGLVFAIALALGIAWWEERRDPRIYSEATIAEVTGLKTIAALPQS